MTWAPRELQKTLWDILHLDATIISLGVTGVFDSTSVPEEQPFPFITVGDNPMDNRSNHTNRGWSSSVTIHVWYQEAGRGRKKVQEIQARIDELLNTVDICVDGWNIVNLRAQFVDVIVDIDNVTLHGIQIFNLLLGEA